MLMRILPPIGLALTLSSCALADLAIDLPTESTLVFQPSKSVPSAKASADKAECETFAHAKTSQAREARVTKDTIGQVAAVGLGAAGGSLIGSSLGATGVGAATGATAGGAYGAAAGMLKFDTTYQGIFDAWFAKCVEEHGHSVKAPSGAGTLVGVPLR